MNTNKDIMEITEKIGKWTVAQVKYYIRITFPEVEIHTMTV